MVNISVSRGELFRYKITLTKDGKEIIFVEHNDLDAGLRHMCREKKNFIEQSIS